MGLEPMVWASLRLTRMGRKSMVMGLRQRRQARLPPLLLLLLLPRRRRQSLQLLSHT